MIQTRFSLSLLIQCITPISWAPSRNQTTWYQLLLLLFTANNAYCGTIGAAPLLRFWRELKLLLFDKEMCSFVALATESSWCWIYFTLCRTCWQYGYLLQFSVGIILRSWFALVLYCEWCWDVGHDSGSAEHFNAMGTTCLL